MRKPIIYTLIALAVLIAGGVAAYQMYYKTSGPQEDPPVAAYGHDPVAYYKRGYATPGSEDLAYVYDGARWYFANEENRETFKKNPEKYTPEYGGYCAFMMARGRAVPSNPKLWKIVDGNLYMNCSIQMHIAWQQNLHALIRQADEHWKRYQESIKSGTPRPPQSTQEINPTGSMSPESAPAMTGSGS